MDIVGESELKRTLSALRLRKLFTYNNKNRVFNKGDGILF